MAVVQGIKEKVHLPIYDSLRVEGEKQWSDVEKSSTLRFFVDVQGKTKLETNLQAAGLLPHYNTFEARAMRVVISDLPPKFPEAPSAEEEGFDVTDVDDNEVFQDDGGNIGIVDTSTDPPTVIDSDDDFTFVPSPADLNESVAVTADLKLGLDRLVELLKQARASDDGFASIPADEEGVTLTADGDEVDGETVADLGGLIWLSTDDLEGFLFDDKQIPENKRPLPEQLDNNNGSGTIVGKLIYNTVTTFFVGEKIMIQMPTWFFPAGAGVYSEGASFTTHGEPSPTATFRFAEPIFIDKQQNFRVEMEIPDADTLKEIQRIYGPLTVWVVLDGYMTRDVQ